MQTPPLTRIPSGPVMQVSSDTPKTGGIWSPVLAACSKRSGKPGYQSQSRILVCTPCENKQWDDCSWMKTRKQFIFTLIQKMSYYVPRLLSENNGCSHHLCPNGWLIMCIVKTKSFLTTITIKCCGAIPRAAFTQAWLWPVYSLTEVTLHRWIPERNPIWVQLPHVTSHLLDRNNRKNLIQQNIFLP